MMKNSKLKFSEYMQNISRFKSFRRFVLIVHEFMIALQGLITPPQLVLVITQCPFSVPGKEMQWLLRPEK